MLQREMRALKLIRFQNKGHFSFRVSAFTAVSFSRSNPRFPVGLQRAPDSLDSGFILFSEKSSVPLSSSFHSPGRSVRVQLVFSAHREVEPAVPAQREPQLLHREVAAAASGQLPVPAQLLLQR